MKRNKSLIAGIVCALLCAFCVFAYTGSVKANAEAERAETLERFGGEQVEVYVATRTISPGEMVDARSAETRLWIADLLPEGSVHDLATVAGKKATAAIYEGEVITEYRFDTASSNLTVPEGFVAVSVPAQEVNAVGGAVMVGSRINIYAAGAQATELIGENILVLATSSLASDSLTSTSTDWITIAVSPESVQQIIAATQTTKLYFSLPSLSLSRLGSSTVVSAEALEPLPTPGEQGGDLLASENPSSDEASAMTSEDGLADEALTEEVIPANELPNDPSLDEEMLLSQEAAYEGSWDTDASESFSETSLPPEEIPDVEEPYEDSSAPDTW